ncbi:MAG TPA: hypothetical protein VKU94_03475 [Geobacterales bacterium]|nr:hypothetical protein [Geobacterales bacterium]
MSRGITLSRRLIAVIILVIIGASLIAYFLYPQKPQQVSVTYTYYATVYDVIGNKTNTIAQNITVNLKGISNANINITLSSPNYNNSTYQFSNLTAGDYLLKITSKENLLLYNETLHIDKDTYQRIVIPAQPLTLQVLLNGAPSKVQYNLNLKNTDRNFNVNVTISTSTGSYSFTEIPLGHYIVTMYYLGLPVNQTNIYLSGTSNFVNLNTKLLNLKFLLKDNRTGVLNQTSLYFMYQDKYIGPYVSASNGTITAQNVPPLKFNVIFSYKGLNVTTKESPILDLSSTSQTFFNFTTTLGNLTLKVHFDNGTPANGLGVILSPNLKATLGSEGNVTLLNLPAQVNIQLAINKSSYVILKTNITLESYKNNTINLVINKYSLKYTLQTLGDISKFKIYYLVQDNLNISPPQQILTSNLDIQLYPSIYTVYIFVYTPSNSSMLLYQESVVLNSTLNKSVKVPLGFTLNVNTSSNEDVITLYYVDQTGSYKVAQASGGNAKFTDLIPGQYRVVVTRANSFISSTYLQISNGSPSEMSIYINTSSMFTLTQAVQESAIVLVILLIIVALLSYGVYRSYKSKKQTK